jgi:hypothetical protein
VAEIGAAAIARNEVDGLGSSQRRRDWSQRQCAAVRASLGAISTAVQKPPASRLSRPTACQRRSSASMISRLSTRGSAPARSEPRSRGGD